MASVVSDVNAVPHLERTANDARQRELYTAVISRVEQVNKTIRNIRLSLSKSGPRLRHLPGQYIDLQIPSIPVVGGFTITSPPQTATAHAVDPITNKPLLPPSSEPDFPYIELSIQYSPNNPPAAYLWRTPTSSILNKPVTLRIGGNFHHPPTTLSLAEFQEIQNVVFIAGGVGINPIISMLCAMDLTGPNRLGGMLPRVRVLYSSKRDTSTPTDANSLQPGKVLFEDRLQSLAEKYRGSREVDFGCKFFGTAAEGGAAGRMTHQDLLEAVDGGGGSSSSSSGGDGSEIDAKVLARRKRTLVYICGVPKMTDEFVKFLSHTEGLDERRVLCEKWW